MINGSYTEHNVEHAYVCDTCGSVVIKTEAHTQWHEIITDAITHPPTFVTTGGVDVDMSAASRDDTPCRACGHKFVWHYAADGCHFEGCDCQARP